MSKQIARITPYFTQAHPAEADVQVLRRVLVPHAPHDDVHADHADHPPHAPLGGQWGFPVTMEFELEFMVYWLMVMVVVFVGYVIIVVSEIMLMRKLNALGSTTNAATRKVQAEFKLALTALAVCPLIFLLLPCSYFLVAGMFSLRPPPGLSSFVTMMTSSIAVANPIATIVTVRPYRNKVKEWVNRATRRKVFAAAGSVVSGASKSGLVTTMTTKAPTKRNFHDS